MLTAGVLLAPCSPLRLQELWRHCAMSGTLTLRPLKNVVTRWLSLLGPLSNMERLWPALLLMLEDQGASTASLFNELSDFYLLVAVAAVGPMLRKANMLMKLCQERVIFCLNLLEALEDAKRSLTAMYLGDDAFTSPDFNPLKSLVKVSVAVALVACLLAHASVGGGLAGCRLLSMAGSGWQRTD